MFARTLILFILAGTAFAEPPPIVVEKPPEATVFSETSRGEFGVWVNPVLWRENPQPKDLFQLKWTDVTGNIHAIMESSTRKIPLDNFPGMILENGRKNSPEFNLVSHEYRIVSGKKVILLTVGWISNRVHLTTIAYLYSGVEGTVRLATTFPTKDAMNFEPDALTFLNGLQIGKLMEAGKSNAQSVTKPAITESEPIDLQALNESVPYPPKVINQNRIKEILGSDPVTRAGLLQFEADQGNQMAMYYLSQYYSDGKWVEKNLDNEIKWLKKSVLHGCNEAKNALGNYYWTGHGVPIDHDQAAKLFKEAASGGIPAAQNNFGHCLLKGEGVIADPKEGIRWIKEAAKNGDSVAQNNLGISYGKGIYNPKDLTQSIFWFKKAADQGVAEAELWVGVAYLSGQGVEKNVTLAEEWLHKAADQNSPLACYQLGALYNNSNKVEALVWMRKAADLENPMAQYYLAICYYNGEGVEKDQFKALEWFKKAANSGLPQAQLQLGLVYLTGFNGFEKDVNESVKWTRKAADQGDSAAESQMGMFYENGVGVELDHEEAVRWFRFAAIHGNARGQNAFGYALATGSGVKKDLVEAYKWYLIAMDQNDPDPKARAGYNKNSILPEMTLEQIREGKKRALEFVPVKDKEIESDPFSINAA